MSGTSGARALSADKPPLAGRSDPSSSPAFGRARRVLSTIRRRGLSYLLYVPFGAWIPRWFYERFTGSREHRRQLIVLGLATMTAAALIVSVLLAFFGPIVPSAAITLVVVGGFFWLRGGRATLEVETEDETGFLEWKEWNVPSADEIRHRGARTGGRRRADAGPTSTTTGGRTACTADFQTWWTVTEDEFVPRRRFSLDLVLVEGRVLVRKDYRGDRQSFSRELAALRRLRGVAGAPQLHAAHPERTTLYKSWIPGATLRDRLAASRCSDSHRRHGARSGVGCALSHRADRGGLGQGSSGARRGRPRIGLTTRRGPGPHSSERGHGSQSHLRQCRDRFRRAAPPHRSRPGHDSSSPCRPPVSTRKRPRSADPQVHLSNRAPLRTGGSSAPERRTGHALLTDRPGARPRDAWFLVCR